MMASNLEKQLGKIFGPKVGRAKMADSKPAPKSKTVAILPSGAEIDVVRRKVGKHVTYRIDLPAERLECSTLRDLQFFIEDRIPGVTFDRRPA